MAVLLMAVLLMAVLLMAGPLVPVHNPAPMVDKPPRCP